MATAKQLPSGAWRVRVGIGHGKTKSFTAPTKIKAEIAADQWLAEAHRPQEEKTIGECIDDYISIKENILSPTTISGYRKIKRVYLEPICPRRLCDVTENDVQALINRMALKNAPKTVRNAYGLLSAVFTAYRPKMVLRVTLPQKKRRFVEFPEIADIIRATRGTPVELPVLMGLWLGMRMSEIRGAKKSDIRDGILTIRQVIVDADGKRIEKETTKTFASARRLALPAPILALIAALPPEQEYLTTLSGQSIYKRFSRLLEHAGLPHIRFHDLRHLNASVMSSLGIPDKYAMERGGWSTPAVMREVYQHTFTAKRREVDRQVDEFFGDLYAEIENDPDE